MQYYYCADCNGLMDEYEAFCLVPVPEIHNELSNKPVEWTCENHCIYCNSTNLEEAMRCESCGELFPRFMLDENWLCEDRREKAEKEDATHDAATP